MIQITIIIAPRTSANSWTSLNGAIPIVIVTPAAATTFRMGQMTTVAREKWVAIDTLLVG